MKIFLTVLLITISFKLLSQTFNTNDVEIYPISTTNENMSENSIFISRVTPNLIVSANNSWNTAQIPHDNVGVFISNDYGSTWSGNFFFSNDAIGDPSCSIDLYNRIYVSYISNTGNNTIAFRYSDDSGNTWSQAFAIVQGPNVDKPHFFIDNRPNGNPDFIVCSYRDQTVSGIKTIMVTTSTDRGQNWSSPVDLCTGVAGLLGASQQSPNITIGPEGNVYITWAIYDVFTATNRNETALGFAKFDGTSWTSQRVNYYDINTSSYSPLTIKGINSTGTFYSGKGGGRTPSFPSIATNQQNGNIYITWCNQGMCLPTGSNSGDPDILLVKSTDHGSTWNDAITVNQDFSTTTIDQWFPYISCDPFTGTLGIIYYDSRDFVNNDNFNVYLSVSNDDATTWNDYLITDNSTNSLHLILGAHDYNGFDMCNGLGLPIWTDDRNNYFTTYTQTFAIPCDNDLYLCNPVTSFYKVEKAQNTITLSDNNCGYEINSGGDIRTLAGNYICFKPGFHSAYGSKMHSSIVTNCDASAIQRVIAPNNSDNVSLLSKSKDLESFSFSAFPNPCISYLTVRLKSIQTEEVSISITNVGSLQKFELLKGFNLLANNNINLIFDIGSKKFKSGIYTIEVTSGQNKYHDKICIQKN